MLVSVQLETRNLALVKVTKVVKSTKKLVVPHPDAVTKKVILPHTPAALLSSDVNAATKKLENLRVFDGPKQPTLKKPPPGSAKAPPYHALPKLNKFRIRNAKTAGRTLGKDNWAPARELQDVHYKFGKLNL